jgi:hypothetical protein
MADAHLDGPVPGAALLLAGAADPYAAGYVQPPGWSTV